MNMLEILKNRLPEGLEIKKVREKPSKYEIAFLNGGKEYNGALPKTCAPGCQDRVADHTICIIMCTAEMDKGNIRAAGAWLDKIARKAND